MYVRTSKIPDDLKEITREAISFFLKQFCDPELVERIVGIKVMYKKFPDEYKDALAWCDYKDKSLPETPNEFVLCFNVRYTDIRTREYLLTLFHELTHMRQYASGQLIDLESGDNVWLGKTYPLGSEYWLQPWELEAQGLELSAYQLFSAAHPEYKLGRFRPKYGGRGRSGWRAMLEQAQAKKRQ